MIIPSAEMIETAETELDEVDALHLSQQASELGEALGKVSTDFEQGFHLGLQTARVFLAGNMAAVKAKVEF